MSRAWGGRGQNYPRPENALKRAEELLRVGQKQAALQTLHNVFTGSGRRFRTWSSMYETIIIRHLDLCCEMRKGRYAKEALQQYRNMCQSASIQSLEEAITHFMKRAQEKADEARAASDAAALDFDDLDVEATPEDIMLSYVSGDKSKDRTDRTMVTPWFRFLWETYRNLLDILRHNSRLQMLYASSIKRAFTFCVSYKRTSEFRRLCELLRSHLANIQKRALYKDQKDRPDLTNVETLQLYVETRFAQLKAACQLELWQEAFRSVEDIISLVVIKPSIIQPSMMATYYSHLTQIFAFSDESSLYCAYAWHKLYKLAIQFNKKLTEVDVQMLSTSVLLAALGICPYNRENALHREVRSDAAAERLRRMSSILRFGLESKNDTAETYSREALLKELSNDKFLSNVPEQVQALYHLLEHEFNPLEMCKNVDRLTEQLSDISVSTSTACPDISVDLSRHAPSLKFVAVLKMLQQLSQIYSNISTHFLVELVPSMDFGEIESIIVNAVKNRYIKIRMDHKDQVLHFGEDNLDSDSFARRLSTFAERFSTVESMILAPDKETRNLSVKVALIEARDNLKEENTAALARKQMIEQRKEEQEQFLLEKERQEERKRRELTQQVQAAEALRRQQEAERREQERIQREKEEREIEEAKAMLEKGKKKLKPGQKLDKQKIYEEVLMEQLKEQRELDSQLNRMSKQLDHLERALREEEAPLIMEAQKQRIAEERAFHEEDCSKNVENHKKAWEIDVAEKRRLQKMVKDKEIFAESIRSRRREEFERRQRAREREIAERKEKRHLERLRRKIEQFTEESREEIIRIVKEQEEERKKEEQEQEEARARREREKREEEFQKQLEITRKREAEMEEKKRQQIDEAYKVTSKSEKWTRGTESRVEESRWEPTNRRPTPLAASNEPFRPPQIRTQESENRRDTGGAGGWQRVGRSPPRTPERSPGGDWRRNPSTRDNEPWRPSRAPAPRSPISGPRTATGFVPSGGRYGYQDNRPPPSSYQESSSYHRPSDQSWSSARRDEGYRSQQGQSRKEESSQSKSSSTYVPPGRRQQEPRDDRSRKDRW